MTWQSNTASLIHQHPYWNGALTFLPEGWDPKWTVTLNFQFAENWPEKPYNTTWLYLTADINANPDWMDDPPYNISCSYPADYNSQYNVMTLSGTDLVVSLYAPNDWYSLLGSTFPDVDVTLVFRQRWPHEPYKDGYQDSLVMPCLRFQDYDDERL